jgi:uncharacterized protein
VIWVISDTHMTRSQILPAAFIEKIGREDVILHLGDLVSFEVMEYLSGLCHFEAVRGNCDMPDVRRGLAPKKIIEIEGRKIGLMHGQGGVTDSLNLVKGEYAQKVDIALFGHTHEPYYSREGETLYFNPGSMSSGRNSHNTYGVLHLDEEIPWGEIVEL